MKKAERIKGLSLEEVKRSLEQFGDNSLKKARGKGFFGKLLENLSDPIIRILIIALIVEIIFTLGNCNYFEIFGIVTAIMISSLVSTISEFRSEKAFEKLNDSATDTGASVLRDGEIKKISVSDIVVGDIVYLSSGEKIPADGIIISGRISVDQSALNGESIECKKEPADEYGWDLSSKSRAFRGSLVTEGNAVMRVGRVGESTYFGMVAKDVQTETRESPLKLRLAKLANDISKIGYVVAALVGVCYLFNAFFVDNGFSPERMVVYFSDFQKVFSTLIHTLTLMITVVVVAAPEGLPMMITVVLSANMKKMLADKILVKKLVGIETAGSMNILFTDKTGTLTVGRPECARIVTADGTYKSLAGLSKAKKLYEYLTLSAKLNTDVIKSGDTVTSGNATDKAVFTFFEEGNPPYVSVKSKTSFSSDRKYSSVTLSDGRVFIKGAPEIILSDIELAYSSKGEIQRVDKELLQAEYKNAAGRGERVIAVAVKEGRDTIFLALLVMKDKLRRDVFAAVEDVTRAGIQIVMVTGDGKETAEAIASECGIMIKTRGDIALTSSEISSMSDEELKKILPRLRVVARALPRDKSRLVRLSQELDMVVV